MANTFTFHVSVNPNLVFYPSPYPFPFDNHKFVLYVCDSVSFLKYSLVLLWVLYWCTANHPKLIGSRQWQHSFWTCNLDRAQWGQLVSAPCGVSWDVLKAEGHSCWPTHPPLLQASIHGYISCGCSQNFYAWTFHVVAGLPHWLVPAFSWWVSREDWTEAVLPFMTWFAKPHRPPRWKGEDLDLMAWYRRAASCTIFRLHLLVTSCDICLSLSDFLHWVWLSLGPSMLQQMAVLHSFLRLSSIPSHIWTTSSLSIPLLMGI